MLLIIIKKNITTFEGKKFRLQDIFELISSLVSSCNTLTHNHRISEVTPFQTISVMKKKCLLCTRQTPEIQDEKANGLFRL